MTITASKRSSVAARRFGYLVAVGVNGVMLYLVNVRPGWSAVPFLTDDTRLVLGLVNASIIVSLVANLVYLVHDPRWLKGLGDMVTSAVGVASALRLWDVFPFAFPSGSLDWVLVARILLFVAIVGGAIGIVAGFIAFVRGVVTRSSSPVGQAG